MHKSTRSNRNFGRNSDLIGIVQEEFARGWAELGFRNGCTFEDVDWNQKTLCDNVRRVADKVIGVVPKEDPWKPGGFANSIRDQLWPESNRIGGKNPLTLCAAQWVTGDDGEFPPTLEGLTNLVNWINKELVPRGCNGMEAVLWQHKDPMRLLSDDSYRDKVIEIHQKLPCVDVMSSHLIGQCVTDPIRRTHKNILPDAVWGDGFPHGVNFRAAVMYMLMPVISKRLKLNDVTHGFCGGSGLWQVVYDFVRNEDDMKAGLKLLSGVFNPILDVFTHVRHLHALEVHGTEAACCPDSFDVTRSVLNRPEWGVGYDPSHHTWQGVDSAYAIARQADLLYHFHFKSVTFDLSGRTSIMRGYKSLGQLGGGWQFDTIGNGHNWRRQPENLQTDLVVPVQEAGYHGNVSAENEKPRAEPKGQMMRAIENIVQALYVPTTVEFLPDK